MKLAQEIQIGDKVWHNKAVYPVREVQIIGAFVHVTTIYGGRLSYMVGDLVRIEE